jgi:hypothetical protein
MSIARSVFVIGEIGGNVEDGYCPAAVVKKIYKLGDAVKKSALLAMTYI